MLTRLRNYLFFGLIVAGFYYLLSHHLVFTGLTSYDVLKKQELSFKYTFFSLKQVSPEAALRARELREDGLGQLMVEKGIISEAKLQELLRKYQDE